MTRTEETRETDKTIYPHFCDWQGFYSRKAVIFFSLTITFYLLIKKNDAEPGYGAVCTLIFCVGICPKPWEVGQKLVCWSLAGGGGLPFSGYKVL